MKIRDAALRFVLFMSIVAVIALPSCTNTASPGAADNPADSTESAFVLPQENPPPESAALKQHSVEMFKLNGDVPSRGELSAEQIFPKKMPPSLAGDAPPFNGAPDPKQTKLLMLCAHLEKDNCAEYVLPGLTRMAELSDSMWGGFFKRNSFHKELRRNARVLSTMLEYVKSGAQGYEKLSDTSVLAIEYITQFLAAPEGGFFFGQNADMQIENSVVPGKEFYSASAEDRLEMGMPSVFRKIDPIDNALMSEVLFTAADIYDRPEWRKLALDAIERISHPDFTPGACEVEESIFDGICGGQEITPHVYLLKSYLDAYEGTGETVWLDRAKQLADYLIAQWYDEDIKDFGFISFVDEGDFSMPGANIQMVSNLDRLYTMTDNKKYSDIAGETLDMVWNTYPDEDSWLGPSFELAAYYHFNHPLKIVVVGPRSDPATESLRRQASVFYEPNKVIMVLDPEEDAARLDELPYSAQPQPTLYACVVTACSMPMDSPQAVSEMLPRFVDRYMYGQNQGIKKFKLD